MPSALAESRAAPAPAPVLAEQAEQDLLRFIVCGSVDDGKSTLIGRLLYETGSVPADQLETLAAESRRFGTQGTSLDLSLLVDGLSAEREQGITIDVAYRYFATAQRKFIVIDAPGHEQYTRNMVTGASQADFGVLLVDARQGLTEQTRRHARVLKMLGVGGMVLVVNKMDRVRFLEDAFDEIVSAFGAFARDEGIEGFQAVPLSALTGANVAAASSAMPWYDGPPLLGLLENVPVGADEETADQAFRMPVQLALRPDEHFRGFAGTIAAGTVAVGDRVVIQPSGRTTTVSRIVTFDGDRQSAAAGEAIVLVLADAVDCARGDVISAAEAPLQIASRFEADLVWLDETPFRPERDYALKSGSRTLPVRLDFARSGGPVTLNAMLCARVETSGLLPAAIYADEPRAGAFIVIDRESGATVAAGMIRELDANAHAGSGARSGEIVWFDSSQHGDPAAELARIAAALSTDGKRVLALTDADFAEDLCADLSPGTEAWARRALAGAGLAARGGTTVAIASTAPLPADANTVRRIDGANAIAPDWVI